MRRIYTTVFTMLTTVLLILACVLFTLGQAG